MSARFRENITSLGMNNPNNLVPCIHGASLTPQLFFERYQKPGKPVALTGLLDDEPEWNLDYLCEKLGDRIVPVRFYGRERYEQDKRTWTSMGSTVESQSMPFVQYAELLRNQEARDKDIYLGKCTLANTSLVNTTRIKRAEAQLSLRMPATDLNLWLGLGGHTTCLHCDPFDGTLMQLYGAKKILLFPPTQLYNLYPFSVLNHLRYGLRRRASYSQVYPERPDFVSFPKFRKAVSTCYEIILNQREILYIPAGWWHEVTSLGEGVVCSVNRFWQVLPISRALLSWNKWRIHLASVLTTPHILGAWLTAITDKSENKKFASFGKSSRNKLINL